MARTIPIIPARAAGAPLEFRQSPPLALYIHVPWCVQKCPYCDFNSHEAKGEVPEAAYIDALIADLESALPLIWGRPVVSIFFGGGTPSLLSAEGVDRLLMAVRARVPLLPDAEITLEANPGTVEASRFAGFRAAGVNRVSVGIQSFNPEHLKALGRIHDRDEAGQAAALARQHFDTFNLDLMYGLPEQTLEQALADLETALDCQPTHLSCYQLTLEPNTRFAAQPPAGLPEGDLCADMQDAIEARLAAAGFRHYETSAFAQPGHECRHNRNYWLFGDYLGIGAGAHSKLTLHDRLLRQMRWKHPEAYLKQVAAGSPVQEETQVAADALPFEFMMNALRLNQGFDPALYAQRTSLPLAGVMPTLQALQQEGLLEVSPERIAPTDTGRRFLNHLLQRFLG
ncbi:MAG TPA: radical SAM family heme chaperone HemW [Rhodocyclaceae bacterium]|nr:radical SAM family heme chaperone HemW [Rhodocyclaceae bacterium]